MSKESIKALPTALHHAGGHMAHDQLALAALSWAVAVDIELEAAIVFTRRALLAFMAERPEFSLEILSRVIQRLRLATRLQGTWVRAAGEM